MIKPFASSADTAADTETLEELDRGVRALTAGGDLNVGAIESEEILVCIKGRATPPAARDWLAKLRGNTNKPVR